ncbi:MAG: NAD-dependent epimerase/dehydratase family protein, partial [Myxococcota bacterium]|nr:NAD-dependent epimerase/dehydratase family protein [Myxococcota bacterium]
MSQAADLGHPPKRALVTGPGGFLGRHLCRQLISEGWEVRGLQRSQDQGLETLGVELISGSVLDAKVLMEASEDCSI